MALPAGLIWEVRSTGSDSNGGAFLSGGLGTDYSQQASAEATYTDLVIGNPTTTQLSSSARPFVAADKDNVLNVTGGVGFTTGRYRVSSVSGGVATMDRSVGVAGSTAGAGRLGGCLAGLQQALTSMVASNTIYVRHGSLTVGNPGLTGAVGGTLALPSRIIGYQSTRADGLQATITAASGTPTILLALSNAYWFVRNLNLDCATLVATGLRMSGSGSHTENCTFRRWTQMGFNATASAYVRNCWATAGSGGTGTAVGTRAGFCLNGSGTPNTIFSNCATTSSTSNGFASANNAMTLINCVAWDMQLDSGAGGHGVQISGANEVEAHNCTFALLQGSGVYADTANALQSSHIENCIFATIDRYGIENLGTAYSETLAYPLRLTNNAYYSCSLGQRTGVPTGTNEVSLTADPFTDTALGDLDLNITTGGGASCRSAGWPSAFIGLPLVAGAMDIGALQATVASNDVTVSGLQACLDLWREYTAEFSTTRVPDPVIYKYLQSALESFNNLTNYNYSDTTISLVANQQEYTLANDTCEIIWVEYAGLELRKADIDELRRRGVSWRTEAATAPDEWAYYGQSIVLIPKPDAAAVVASPTLTVRYVRSPRDVGVYGPENLAPVHYRLVVMLAAHLWSAAHPDSSTAVHRMSSFIQLYQQDVATAVEYYRARGLVRSALPPDGGGKRK